MRVALALVAVALLASCGEPYAVPDPDDPDVAAAEAELAPVVGAALDGATCEVRLIGVEGNSSFVWARCSWTTSDGIRGGMSGPMRVDGTEVQMPGDGSLFEEDVRRLFPADLADVILRGGFRD